jgi:hypothetical protein
MYLRPVDVTDIRSANGTATGLSLAEDIIDSLRPNSETLFVSEEGYATIRWNKTIPTSMIGYATTMIFAERDRCSL